MCLVAYTAFRAAGGSRLELVLPFTTTHSQAQRSCSRRGARLRPCAIRRRRTAVCAGVRVAMCRYNPQRGVRKLDSGAAIIRPLRTSMTSQGVALLRSRSPHTAHSNSTLLPPHTTTPSVDTEVRRVLIRRPPATRCSSPSHPALLLLVPPSDSGHMTTTTTPAPPRKGGAAHARGAAATAPFGADVEPATPAGQRPGPTAPLTDPGGAAAAAAAAAGRVRAAAQTAAVAAAAGLAAARNSAAAARHAHHQTQQQQPGLQEVSEADDDDDSAAGEGRSLSDDSGPGRAGPSQPQPGGRSAPAAWRQRMGAAVARHASDAGLAGVCALCVVHAVII
jgi:hypothetical protein